MAYEVKAILTEAAQAIRNFETTSGNWSVCITHFTVGSKGYDPVNPNTAIDPIAKDTGLGEEVFRSNIYTGLDISATETELTFKLESVDAVTSLGELGIYGKILVNNVPPNFVAEEEVLYALLHYPRYKKSINDIRIFNIRLPILCHSL